MSSGTWTAMESGGDSQARPSPPTTNAATLLRRGAPWAVAVAILAFLISRVPIGELELALRRTSLGYLALVALIFVTATLVADSLALWVALRRCLADAKISMADTVVMRGASYLLALISYGAGQGGVVWFLKRHYHVPIGAGAGAVLLATGAFIIVIAAAVGMGIGLGAVPDSSELRWLALAVAIGIPIYLLLIAIRPRLLNDRALLRPLFEAGVVGTLEVAGARALHTAVLIAGHWLAMKLFGIEVPAAAAIAHLPVLFLVSALPISPSGLGTTQAAAITLFAGYAPGADAAAQEAAVLSYSLAYQLFGAAVTALLGMICLRRLTASEPDGAKPPDSDPSQPYSGTRKP